MHARALSLMPGRKTDCPGNVGLYAVTTTIHQAADAANGIAQGDAGSHDIAEFPDGQCLDDQKNQRAENRANQPAVKYEAAMVHHKDFGPGFAGQILFPISDHIEQARADDGADDDPEARIPNRFRGDADLLRAPARVPKPKPEAQRHEDAVPMDRQGPDLKRDLIHKTGNVRTRGLRGKWKFAWESGIAYAA